MHMMRPSRSDVDGSPAAWLSSSAVADERPSRLGSSSVAGDRRVLPDEKLRSLEVVDALNATVYLAGSGSGRILDNRWARYRLATLLPYWTD